LIIIWVHLITDIEVGEITMNRLIFLILTVIIAGCQSGSVPQETSLLPSLEYQRPAFKFTEVVDGVYQATGTENLPTWCNAAIIINESDVVIVDTHLSPAAATALLEELHEITQKPVRYVIDTHFHFDHVFGNQIYPSNVEIIGHEFTRDAIASGSSNSGRAYDWFIGGIPSEIASLRKKLDSVSDQEERTELEQSVAYEEKVLAGVRDVEPTAPNISFSQLLTLHRGPREIRIVFLGRGHTGGDVVVHLPDESVLITGDLMYESIPYMGDGYFLEWIETLEHLKSLEFDWVIPGHGPPFQDRNRIDYLQAYLRDFWERVQALHATGVSAAEAANSIDMRDHAKYFPEIQSIGVHPLAAVRAYELLERNKMQ
jgi:glyoxylase-like metal-dependent hydrolase (beta-lactamase superfamily II)